MKNKIEFKKSFRLSIIRLFIFLIFVLWITWHTDHRVMQFSFFKFYRMNRVTIWNIKWRNFSCKVIQFSSQKKFFTHTIFFTFFSPHIQWYGIPWRLKESWHVSRARIDLAKCYLETHEGTGPCPWWHPDEFTQIKNGYFSPIRPPCASILSAFRTQFWINIFPFQNTTFV